MQPCAAAMAPCAGARPALSPDSGSGTARALLDRPDRDSSPGPSADPFAIPDPFAGPEPEPDPAREPEVAL